MEHRLPGWLQQLQAHYLSNAARLFVLSFNIDDYVLAPGDTGPQVTQLIPFLEHYGRSGGFGGQPFGAIFRYSQSGGLTPDDTADLREDALNTIGARALAGAAIGAAVGTLTGGQTAQGALTGAAVGAGIGASDSLRGGVGEALFRDHSRHVGELDEPLQVLRTLESILRSIEPRSLVIIER